MLCSDDRCRCVGGLRELGKALGLGLGVQITGPAALAEVERLTAERDALAAQVARVEEVLDHWRTVDEGNAAYAERIGERSRFADGLASRADMLRAALADADTGEQEAPFPVWAVRPHTCSRKATPIRTDRSGGISR
jgi:hypothetical protein